MCGAISSFKRVGSGMRTLAPKEGVESCPSMAAQMHIDACGRGVNRGGDQISSLT